MELLLQIEGADGLSFEDIDRIIELTALSGYGGAVIPRMLTAQELMGFCRSSGRYGISLFIQDDDSAVSGAFGGEVTSVEEFAPKIFSDPDRTEDLDEPIQDGIAVRREASLWGADPFDPRAVEAFIDCSYRPLKRWLSRFFGYEVKGIVTGFGDFRQLPYSPALSAYADKSIGFVPEENPDRLFVPGEKRDAYISCAKELFTQTCLKKLGAFCSQNDLELVARTDCSIPEAQRYADMNTAFVNLENMSFARRNTAVFSRIAEGVPRFVLRRAELAPSFMEAAWCSSISRLGKVFRDSVVEQMDSGSTQISANSFVRNGEKGFFLANISDSPAKSVFELPDDFDGFVYDFSADRLYAAPKAISFILEGGGGLLIVPRSQSPAESLPPFLYSGVELGEFTEAEEVGLSDVDMSGVLGEQSSGCLCRKGMLPYDCSGKFLALDGKFGCALIKIGRRRERLILPPFMIALGSQDEGRIAEITVFPETAQENERLTLNSVNIVTAEC